MAAVTAVTGVFAPFDVWLVSWAPFKSCEVAAFEEVGFPAVGCAGLIVMAFARGLAVSTLVGVIGMAALWGVSVGCRVFCDVAMTGMDGLGRFLRTFFMGGGT